MSSVRVAAKGGAGRREPPLAKVLPVSDLIQCSELDGLTPFRFLSVFSPPCSSGLRLEREMVSGPGRAVAVAVAEQTQEAARRRTGLSDRHRPKLVSFDAEVVEWQRNEQVLRFVSTAYCLISTGVRALLTLVKNCIPSSPVCWRAAALRHQPRPASATARATSSG